MSKKYQVFISSTYLDLIDERKKVADAISKADHIPVGMELFPASTLAQWQMIKQLIDDCDYYVLIIGARYGSISPKMDDLDDKEISYTQKEYEYAFSKKIPVYTFFKKNTEDIPEIKKEKTEKNKRKLEAFKKLVKNNGYYHEHWDDPEELSRIVLNALNHAFRDAPRPGWVRSDKLIEIAADYSSDITIEEKLIYYKFLHLSEKEKRKPPIYKKFVKRINKTIDIYDEYVTVRINRFSQFVKKFKSYDSTKGSAVEVNSLLPFIMSLRDTDVTADENPNMVQPLIIGPSMVYVTSSHYYNGFQPGNKDAAIKVDKNTILTRLVVDFSSIPNFEKFISESPQIFHSYHEAGGKRVTKNIGNAQSLGTGIFFATMENMQEGDVLRIEFADDFKKISNVSS